MSNDKPRLGVAMIGYAFMGAALAARVGETRETETAG